MSKLDLVFIGSWDGTESLRFEFCLSRNILSIYFLGSLVRSIMSDIAENIATEEEELNDSAITFNNLVILKEFGNIVDKVRYVFHTSIFLLYLVTFSCSAANQYKSWHSPLLSPICSVLSDLYI